MTRPYRPLRLAPEVAGKLNHDCERFKTKAERLEREQEELYRQIRQQHGQEVLWKLRADMRHTLELQQAKQEQSA